MTKYVKLVDNVIEYAPKNKGAIINYDLDVEQMLADGYKEFIQTERPVTNRRYHIEYVEADIIGEIIVYDETQEEADAREAQEERERINNLTCTKRVFALMLQELGIPYSQLKALIATSEQAQLEWELCVELQRGNPLLDMFGQQLGITPEQIDMLFKVANGEIPVEALRASAVQQEEEEPQTEEGEGEEPGEPVEEGEEPQPEEGEEPQPEEGEEPQPEDEGEEPIEEPEEGKE